MTTADIDLTLHFRKKYTPPPSVLQAKALAHEHSAKDRPHRVSPSLERRSRPPKYRHATAHTVTVQVNNLDLHETSISSYGWQRHSDKASQLLPAPDVVYRNTYMEAPKQEKSATQTSDSRSRVSSPRSLSPRSQHSQPPPQPFPRLKTASTASQRTVESSSTRKYDHHQYNSVYDYIRDSIRQIERQRNLKQKYFATRIKRPQNEDTTLRQALREKKNSATGSSRKSSGAFKDDLRSPESFINYINYSREQIRQLQSESPRNPSYQPQATHRSNRTQKTSFPPSQSNSHEPTQSMMMLMTAAVGNA
jgi:hypothetical protein